MRRKNVNLEVPIRKNYQVNVAEKRLNQLSFSQIAFVFDCFTTHFFDCGLVYPRDSEDVCFSTSWREKS